MRTDASNWSGMLRVACFFLAESASASVTSVTLIGTNPTDGPVVELLSQRLAQEFGPFALATTGPRSLTPQLAKSTSSIPFFFRWQAGDRNPIAANTEARLRTESRIENQAGAGSDG